MTVAFDATDFHKSPDNESTEYLYALSLLFAEHYPEHKAILFYNGATPFPSPSNHIAVQIGGDGTQSRSLGPLRLLLESKKAKASFTITHKARFQLFSSKNTITYHFSEPKNKNFGNLAITVDASFVKSEAEEDQKTIISLVPPFAVNAWKNTDLIDKASIKQTLADGKEYFLLYLSHNGPTVFTDSLMAFSLFKKWQRSNVKLLVCGKLSHQEHEKLKTYKYKDDVTLLPLEKRETALAAAYCAILPLEKNRYPFALLNVIGSGTACIATETPIGVEQFGDAVLLYREKDIEGLADQLKNIYRNEKTKKELSLKGIEAAKKFDPMQTLKHFMDSLKRFESH